jgi:hypothetical protein
MEPPYPQQQPGYPQPYQQPGYPPQFPQGQYPPQYQQPGYPPHYQPLPARRWNARGRLLWTWIAFIGLGIAGVVLFAVFAVQWARSTSRLAVPANTNATYGTVIGQSGSDLHVAVVTGTPVLRRSTVVTFNTKSTRTSVAHFGYSFVAVVRGAPAVTTSTSIAFSYTDDPTHGTYLPIAAARLKNATHPPVPMFVGLIGGVVLGLVGAVLLIVWVVKLVRSRREVPRYLPPPGYWPAT